MRRRKMTNLFPDPAEREVESRTGKKALNVAANAAAPNINDDCRPSLSQRAADTSLSQLPAIKGLPTPRTFGYMTREETDSKGNKHLVTSYIVHPHESSQQASSGTGVSHNANGQSNRGTVQSSEKTLLVQPPEPTSEVNCGRNLKEGNKSTKAEKSPPPPSTPVTPPAPASKETYKDPARASAIVSRVYQKHPALPSTIKELSFFNAPMTMKELDLSAHEYKVLCNNLLKESEAATALSRTGFTTEFVLNR
jgi:hypothetical protein